MATAASLMSMPAELRNTVYAQAAHDEPSLVLKSQRRQSDPYRFALGSPLAAASRQTAGEYAHIASPILAHRAWSGQAPLKATVTDFDFAHLIEFLQSVPPFSLPEKDAAAWAQARLAAALMDIHIEMQFTPSLGKGTEEAYRRWMRFSLAREFRVSYGAVRNPPPDLFARAFRIVDAAKRDGLQGSLRNNPFWQCYIMLMRWERERGLQSCM